MAEESSPFEVIAKFRDYLLVILTFIYAFGYISWAVYVYKENLGIISAAESQYFISGLPPVLLFFIIFCIVYYDNITINFVKEQFKNMNINNYIYYTIFTIIILYSLKDILQLLKQSVDYNKSHIVVSLLLQVLFAIIEYLFLSIICAYASVIRGLKGTLSVPNKYDFTLLRSSTRKFFSVIIFSNILLQYYVEIYPNLPQEFGGVRPKKCLIEINKEDYLLDRQDKLIAKKKSNDSSIIVTDTLLVYYYNDEKLIVKTKATNSKTYELSRNITKTIIWYD